MDFVLERNLGCLTQLMNCWDRWYYTNPRGEGVHGNVNTIMHFSCRLILCVTLSFAHFFYLFWIKAGPVVLMVGCIVSLSFVWRNSSLCLDVGNLNTRKEKRFWWAQVYVSIFIINMEIIWIHLFPSPLFDPRKTLTSLSLFNKN